MCTWLILEDCRRKNVKTGEPPLTCVELLMCLGDYFMLVDMGNLANSGWYLGTILGTLDSIRKMKISFLLK